MEQGTGAKEATKRTQNHEDRAPDAFEKLVLDTLKTIADGGSATAHHLTAARRQVIA